MLVKQIMTEDPTCCSAATPIVDIAQLMVKDDCGCIPVLDEKRKPIGVITDRDIICRAVAQRKNPLELSARDCMTTACVTVSPDADVEDCCELMETNQIRRVVVVDAGGACCGMVSQADFATTEQDSTDEILRAVSRPTDTASTVLH